MECIFGIDIGGTNVKLGILSRGGEILDSGSITTMAADGPGRVAERARDWMDEHGGGERSPIAAGVDCAGLVDGSKGFLYSSPNLPGWENTDLETIFSECLSLPVVVENDVNAAAYGEYRRGAGRGTSCFACVTLGTGVGGGIVTGGKIFRGSSGFAGEIGHTVIQIDGPPCSCGKRGHVEALVGAMAIVERARRAMEGGEKSILGDRGQLTVKDIHGAALAGDDLAIDVLAETGRYLGYGLCNIVHLFNPEIIAVGGGIAAAGDFILEHARQTVRQNVMNERLAGVRIVRAELGNTASFTGAALLAAESVSTR
ncbi:MAG TPA: ROK family protein [Patescibacteria group bacterium]|nr:ROK family protein [Patescibacteria group bacterium]